MALGQGSLAGVARVAFEATGLAEFQNDTHRAEAAYRSSTQGMSDSAIRLELAQDKLRRSLAQGPAAYRQQARAELELRRSEEALRSETVRLDHAQDSANRSLGRFGRGAVAGSGIFRGLGRSLAFASGAFLGGTGLVYAIRTSIQAAVEQDRILANLRNSLNVSGFSWAQYGSQIEEATRRTKQLSAFDDEELFSSLQRLIRGTKDVNTGLRLNAAAANLARAAHVNLDVASKALLRSWFGQSAGLSRLGVHVDKGISGLKALKQVEDQTASAAQDFADSSAGATARFSVGIGDLEKAIGRGLLPQFTELTNKAADWLNKAENQARVERDVAEAVDLIEGAVRGLVKAWDAVDGPIEGVVSALGGVENTARDLALLWVAFKVKAVAGFVATAVSSALTSRKMIIDAVAAGRAWDLATRPRVMSVTTVGGGAFAPGGRGAPVSPGRGGFRGALPILGSNLALATVGAVVASAGGGTQRGDRSGQYPRVYAAVEAAAAGNLGPQALAIIRQELGKYSLANAPDANMARAEARLRALGDGTPTGAAGARPGEGRLGGPGGAPPTKPKPGPGRDKPRPRTPADILLDIAREETRAGTAPELRLHRELAARYQAQIDALERRKNLTAAQKQKLAQLYGQLGSEQSAIASIIQEGEATVEAANQAAAAKREAAAKAAAARRAAERERLDKIVASAERASERHAKIVGDTGHDRASLRKAALRGVDATVKGLKDKAGAKGALTAADVHRMQFDFLTKLTGEIGQWGSDFMPDGGGSGQLETNSHVQTQLMYQQNAALHRLIEGAWHPGAQLASADLSAAGWGVGF